MKLFLPLIIRCYLINLLMLSSFGLISLIILGIEIIGVLLAAMYVRFKRDYWPLIKVRWEEKKKAKIILGA